MVATPIGMARDITLRALDVLAGADVLAAEDTRTLRHLMDIHGVPLAGRPLWACHDHNEAAIVPRVLGVLAEGRSVAYASEAGTPLVSDPGFGLVRAAAAAGHRVWAAPGASAALAALTVSGLAADRFLFAGFPPAAKGDRRRFLADLSAVPATVILYESPRRVAATLAEIAALFGPDRPAALCRELTKRHEEVVRGKVASLAEGLGAAPKGEIVLVIGRAEPPTLNAGALDAALVGALREMSIKDSVAFVVQSLGVSRKIAYARALELRNPP
jgi:16S rRNA (cytidine1402-2'-O)-methyltransferase